MPLARFLGPFEPLTLQAAQPAAEVAVPAGGTPPSQALPRFSIEHQQQTNWCWAAVSSSVATFLGPAAWTQCGVASAELSPLACCGADAANGCNQYWTLDAPLIRVGHFNHMASGAAPFADVQNQINSGLPLCCRIAWSGGGSHFVALGGWFIAADGTSYVDVFDPYYGPSTKKYADFVSTYRSPGDSWTHSYYTAKAPVAGAVASLTSPTSA